MNTDKELFWSLLEPEYVAAQMFCRKLTGDRDRGDDLFQDGLVLALTRFSSLRDHDAFRPWLYRILINSFRSSVRRPWWKRFVPITPELEWHFSGDDPLDQLTARRWLQRAFEVLSPEAQTLVTLHELEGWPVADLARMYGKTEGATKAALFRARKKMKNTLVKILEQAETNRTQETMNVEEESCSVAKPGID
jgi:RNA polymerase sigma factor (sigma-70 family)